MFANLPLSKQDVTTKTSDGKSQITAPYARDQNTLISPIGAAFGDNPKNDLNTQHIQTFMPTYGTLEFKKSYSIAEETDRIVSFCGKVPDFMLFIESNSSWHFDTLLKCRKCNQFKQKSEFNSNQLANEKKLLMSKNGPLCNDDACQTSSTAEWDKQQKNIGLQRKEAAKKNEAATK